MLEYGVLTLAAGGTLVAAGPPGLPGMIARHRATASVITVASCTNSCTRSAPAPVDLGSLRALLVSGSPLAPGRLGRGPRGARPRRVPRLRPDRDRHDRHGDPAEAASDPAVLARSVARPRSSTCRSATRPAGPPPGELFVRTPAQATAYWADPAESAEVFTGGWVRTRDLAHLDGDGYLHLLGRARDVIIVNANLVYAGAIERVLSATPPWRRPTSSAGPTTDRRGGARVRRRHRIHTRRRATARAGAAPGRAAEPRTIQVITGVPLTPAGKPDKRALATLS